MTTPTTTPNLPRLRRALAAAIGCEEGALLASSPRPGASWPRHLAAAQFEACLADLARRALQLDQEAA